MKRILENCLPENKEEEKAQFSVGNLKKMVDIIKDTVFLALPPRAEEHELPFGLAGYLYLLLTLEKHMRKLIEKNESTEEILAIGLNRVMMNISSTVRMIIDICMRDE